MIRVDFVVVGAERDSCIRHQDDSRRMEVEVVDGFGKGCTVERIRV